MIQTTEETKPKTFVFVLMPFSKKYTDIYEVGIKPTCQSVGAYCERVDEQMYDGSILGRIYNQIAKADLVIADMSERSPNVFYETGYAHALNKRVILLTQNPDDIPFDLKHYPHIIYSGDGMIASLKSQLEPKIRWCIENPQGSLPTGELLQLSVNGILLEDKPTIDAQMVTFSRVSGGNYSAMIYLSVAIQNVANLVLDPGAFNMALILPKTLEMPIQRHGGVDFRSMTRLSDGRKIYNVRPLAPLFPQGWDTLEIQLRTGEERLAESAPELTIRVFTEVGPRDYPFVLAPQPVERDEFP